MITIIVWVEARLRISFEPCSFGVNDFSPRTDGMICTSVQYVFFPWLLTSCLNLHLIWYLQFFSFSLISFLIPQNDLPDVF